MRAKTQALVLGRLVIEPSVTDTVRHFRLAYGENSKQ
jgi:hypothetical protein